MSQSAFDTISLHLGELDEELTRWISRPHRWKVKPEQLSNGKKLAEDLKRQANELAQARPILIIMLMGGTGVGKSTLLNALAQGTIAEAAFTRPTTREPIVYLHESIDDKRLPESLQNCRHIRHKQSSLEHKILIDTPDLDSNESIHRDRLEAVLPAADIILYVGSQEKYHDQAGWDLFLKHRDRRAFAFVLNKWDRCLAEHSTGLRPDEDLLRDLSAAGFSEPLLFRVCAHQWLNATQTLPEGEQFQALRAWLENGLNQREMEAIRTKGIEQLLVQVDSLLSKAVPPDAEQSAQATESAWQTIVKQEVNQQSDVILASMAPHQRQLQQHYADYLSHPFKGMMGSFVSLLQLGRMRWLKGSLPQLPASTSEPGVSDLTGFAASCVQKSYQQSLSARKEALTDRLIARADELQLPVHQLAEEVQAHLKGITEATYSDTLNKVLLKAENELSGPGSWRKRMAPWWTWLGHLIPLGLLILVFVWQLYAKIAGTMYVSFTDLILMPLLATILGMLLLYFIYQSLVPVSWKKLASQCRESLENELEQRFITSLKGLPRKQATLLKDERQQVKKMIEKTTVTSNLVRQQELTSQVAILYAQ